SAHVPLLVGMRKVLAAGWAGQGTAELGELVCARGAQQQAGLQKQAGKGETDETVVKHGTTIASNLQVVHRPAASVAMLAAPWESPCLNRLRPAYQSPTFLFPRLRSRSKPGSRSSSSSTGSESRSPRSRTRTAWSR